MGRGRVHSGAEQHGNQGVHDVVRSKLNSPTTFRRRAPKAGDLN